MSRALALVSMFAVFAAAQGCGGEPRGEKEPLNIVSLAPLADVTDAFAAMRVQFDRPVVGEGDVGEVLPRVPVRVEPALEVAAHFVDRQTLIVKPLEGMKPATRYAVELTGELGERVGEDGKFSFVHDPLKVRGVTGMETSWTPPRPVFALRSSHPVPASQVVARCELSSADGSAKVELTTPDPGLALASVPLTTAKELVQGSEYRLLCAGLVADGGNEPLAEPFTETLKVYPRPRVVSFAPDGGEVTPDELKMTLRLATPVALDELKKHLRIKPDEASFRRDWIRVERNVYEVELNLDASTDYKVIVRKGLVDEFGQKLEKTAIFEFATTDASPSMSLERGIYAIEAEGKGYPVWTRNVEEVGLVCASVPKRKIVKVLTSDMNYDPWYSAGDEGLDFKELGLRKKTSAHPVPEAKNKWQLTNLDLPGLCGGQGKRGLYLAELSSPEVEEIKEADGGYYPYRLLGNVTDLGVLLKVGPASGLVWVAGISDGEPVQGASVSIYNLQGKKVHSGTTDAKGVARLPGSTKLLAQPGPGDKDQFENEDYYWNDYDYYRSQRLIAVVEKGGDLAVVDGNWANGIQIWNFGLPSDRRSGETRIRGFIQSDRGIYRPGEKVHFKGLVREVSIGEPPRVPAGARIKIHVEDARGASLLEKKVKLTEFGGFSFDLELSEEAHLGDYYVQATIKKQTFREQFVVEEFRPVAFEVEAERAERHVQIGRPLKLGFKASYLFGAPVKDADVEWIVQRRERTTRFARFPDYLFSDAADDEYWYPWWDDSSYASLEFVSDGAGKTNGKGRVRFVVRDQARDLDKPQDYLVQARVTDSTDQTVTKSVVVSAHHSDFYLGLHSQEWVQAVDMPFAVNTVAVAPDGAQVGAKAKLSFSRSSWKCVAAGTYRAYGECDRVDERVFEREIEIPATGNGTERIVPRRPGEYTIRVETKDSRGVRVSASTSVWVIGRGEAFWSGDESARMSLVASKKSYLPGETAVLVPQADTAGATMLVTLERNGVLDAFIVSPESSGEGIEVALEEAHAPNVYASVALIKGRTGEGDAARPRFKLGVVDIDVAADGRRLDVAIETDREDYEPGQRVSGTIRVTSADAPVRAEVSLSAADEGILQLIAYKTPDPMKSFYKSWGLGVDNATNWNRIARLNDPSDIDDEYGADGAGGADDRVRSRFVASAYWEPALITDEDGRIAFEFEAPDNLTAFRLMAVAADVGDRFGSGESRIRINKKLLAKPVLPRFFGRGDRAEVGVVVHNYTGAPGEATVTARLEGLATKKSSKKVKIAKDGSARVRFPVKVGDAEEAKALFEASMGGHSDALVKTLPVRRPVVVDRVKVAAGKIDGAMTAPLSWGEEIHAAESRLELSVDRTGLSELASSLRYLIRYPYGCLEQTLSGLIPLTKVEDLARSMKLEELKGPKLRAFMRLGIAKVLRHQHEDGHFSLWPGARTRPHLTAYALYGLGEAKRAGQRVRKDALERGLKALRSWALGSKRDLGNKGEAGTLAMAAFVLADNGKADSGLAARLFEARASLPVYGKAFLLRALVKGGAPAEQLDVLKGELVAHVQVDGGAAKIVETEGLSYYMSSSLRTTAITLSALLALDRELEIVEQLVNGLRKARRSDGRWGNTQENLYALVALADYARAEAAGKVELTISVGDKQLAEHTLEGGEIFRLSRSLGKLAPGELRVEASGPVHVFASLALTRDVAEDEALDQGFALRREYLDFETEKPVDEVRVGQLIKVRLTLETADGRNYVALVDRLPAGCEAVNTRLATEGSFGEEEGKTSFVWDYKELYDDRVEAFADRMRAGSYALSYLIRATISGEFTAAPAHAEAMYEPTVLGRTAAAKLVVSR